MPRRYQSRYYDKKNVLLTGGAGFIGSHLGERLLALGARVTTVDNLITGQKKNIAKFLSNRKFSYSKGDVVRDEIPRKNYHLIFHLASPASPEHYLAHPLETLRTNSQGLENVLRLAKSRGARVLSASTSEVYGDPLEHPQKETYYGNVNSIGPRSVYDEGKRYAESLIMTYHRLYKTEIRIARIFNTYGPRMATRDGRVIPSFLESLKKKKPFLMFGNGRQTRSFCYVDDLVDGLLSLMAGRYSNPVNIGSPREITIRTLARIMARIAGVKLKLRWKPAMTNDPLKRKPDITLARKLLGWRPQVSLEEGLRLTIESSLGRILKKG